MEETVKLSLVCTWESLSPSLLASFFLSGLLMYFCFWKVLSRAFLWRSENTARRSMPLLGFPLGAKGHENVPGTGTTEEEAGGTESRDLKRNRIITKSLMSMIILVKLKDTLFCIHCCICSFYIVYTVFVFLYLPLYFDCMCIWMHRLLRYPNFPSEISTSISNIWALRQGWKWNTPWPHGKGYAVTDNDMTAN